MLPSVPRKRRAPAEADGSRKKARPLNEDGRAELDGAGGELGLLADHPFNVAWSLLVPAGTPDPMAG
jgi:hypothetical protein